MSLQQEVFAIPQLWSRHLALLGAWSDSAFAATQECLKLHFATWGQTQEISAIEFPFVNLCQPHAVFTLQEQWTIPKLEHLIDYQSAYTQILSETGQRMAQAWADYEVINPGSLPAMSTVAWQIPGWNLSLTSLNEGVEPEHVVAPQHAAPVATHAEAAPLADASLIQEVSPLAPADAADSEELPLQAEFAEMEQQQAADAAAAVVAKARASFPQAPRISASKTIAKSVRTSRSKTSNTKAASPAKTSKPASVSTPTAKKKSSKA